MLIRSSIPALRKVLAGSLMLCAAIGAKAQTEVNAPMTGTPPAGDYFSYTGISLIPGFGFTAAAGQGLRLYIADPDCQPLLSTPSASQNYILTSIPRVANLTSPAMLAGRSTCELMQTVQYLDDIGRPLQTVQVKGSTLGKDVVQPVAYDAAGRESVKYLPYAITTGTSDGSYKPNALTAQANFYTSPPAGVSPVTNPYAVTVFEPSALARVTEQGAPGAAWQPVPNSTGGHTRKVLYSTNNLTPLTDTANSTLVPMYSVSAINTTTQERTLGRPGNYPAGQLYLSISKDENWNGGRARTTEEYKDREGRVILKRHFNWNAGQLEWLSTYYVYDNLGNLAFVLPPLSNADNQLPDQSTLNKLCYQYRYDRRNRLTQKRLPGRDWEYMVYNQLDQVVATQDANQRNKTTPEWTVNRYDGQGRTIMTGIYTYGSTGADVRAAVQQQADNYLNLWENPTGTSANYGYTALTFPAAITTMLSVNYFDDYAFAGSNPYPYAAGSSQTKGLPTGSLVNILGSGNMLWNVSYYDDKGRAVKSFKQHYLRGGVPSLFNYDELSSSYNFNDQDTSLTRRHFIKNAAGNAAVLAATIANTFTYDHTGRKIGTYEKINNGSKVLLAKNEYNETGQLRAKHLHGIAAGSYLQDIAYTYNERGWLSRINDPAAATAPNKLFAEELRYNDPEAGASPQYNGNIAQMKYNTSKVANPGQRSFKYTYDPLDRLTSANFTGGQTGDALGEQLGYDLNGNIKTLARTGTGNTGTLNYTYDGNQLTTVTGYSPRSYTYDGNGNAGSDGMGKDISYNLHDLPQTVKQNGSTLATYTYDAAGNKLRSTGSDGSRDYIDGIVYHNNSLEFIATEEGRALPAATDSTSFNYEYLLKDHLGSNRVVFATTNNQARIVQEDEYYSFGLKKPGGGFSTSLDNRYLYNGKELQTNLTNQYDYGARLYDPVIGRFTSTDPLANEFDHLSPYNYTSDNPILMIDQDGMAPDSINKPQPKPKELKQVTITAKKKFSLNHNIKIKPVVAEFPMYIGLRGVVTSIPRLFELVRDIDLINSFLSVQNALSQHSVSANDKNDNTDVPEGFTETKEFGKQHGQKVYKKGNKYYSKDVDSHNGGVWKVFEKNGQKLKRVGTADKDLNVFKK